MICFENNHEYLLHPAEYSQYEAYISPMLEEEEEILAVCQTVHDGMVFTGRRIIAVDIQGMLGTEADVCSLFYRTVRSFALEKEPDRCRLELFLAGQKQLCFVFDYPDADISVLATAISRFTLQ